MTNTGTMWVTQGLCDYYRDYVSNTGTMWVIQDKIRNGQTKNVLARRKTEKLCLIDSTVVR